MARQTRLTPQLIDAIAADIERGLPALTAARTHGVARSTFYTWLRRGGEGAEPYAELRRRIESRRTGSAEARRPPQDDSSLDAFVGRDAELAVLGAACDEARAGRGRLVLLSGEPGVGKTRLAEEVACAVRDTGGDVLTGRCRKDEGAPALWPWVQILRSRILGSDPALLRAEMPFGAADVARIVPELKSVWPALESPPADPPEQIRFRIFDAVTGFLKATSRRSPLLLVLEDLQEADAASLALVRHLAPEIGDSCLMMIATYRDEGASHTPLAETVRMLAPSPRVQRRCLKGLDVQAVGEFVEVALGRKPSDHFSEVLFEKTAGNALLLREVVRMLATEDELAASTLARLGVPPLVRDAIQQRVDRLPHAARELLEVAAVIGQQFDADVLLAAVRAGREERRSSSRLLEMLATVAAGGLVERDGTTLDRYAFSHALVREALYEALLRGRRRSIHGFVRAALEELRTHDASTLLAQLTHHSFEATRGVRRGLHQALDDAESAAVEASSVGALDEATGLYERAVSLARRDRSVDAGRRGRLLLALGRVYNRAGAFDQGRAPLLDAIRISREISDAELFAEAALEISGDHNVPIGKVDDSKVQLLEEALATTDERNDALRASLLGRLAAELYFNDRFDRIDDLSRESVHLARRTGDPNLIANALIQRMFVLWRPARARERLAGVVEMEEHVRTTRDARVMVEARFWRAVTLLELQDVSGARAAIDDLAERAAPLRQPHCDWLAAVFRAGLAALAGDYAKAAALGDTALAIGEKTDDPKVAISRTILQVEILAARSGLDRVAPLIEDYAARLNPAWRGLLARVRCEMGGGDRGKAILERAAVTRFAEFPRDASWAGAAPDLAVVCGELADRSVAKLLYEDLLPLRGQAFCVPYGVVCYGATSAYLGILAAVLGRWSAAEGHFADAIAENTKMGALPYVARTKYWYARMLYARAAPGDLNEARGLAAEATRIAVSLGMTALRGKIDRLEGDGRFLGDAACASPPATAFFYRSGNDFEIGYEDVRIRLGPTKGLRYLHCLLQAPQVELHALDLVLTASDGNGDRPALRGDAGVMLDATAKEQYRRRLTDLTESLREAEALNDLGRVQSARTEIDFLTGELARAVGLGGRDRRAASDSERARINVARRVKAALNQIAHHDAALSAHLRRAVTTGMYCKYAPGEPSPIAWVLERPPRGRSEL